MNASDLLPFSSKPKVQVRQSSIDNGGQGLYSLGCFPKNTPMVVYHGISLTDQEIYDLYTANHDDYYQLSDHLRGCCGGRVIYGQPSADNPNLQGVYVNDVATICDDTDLPSTIAEYTKTSVSCNLKVVEKVDYPVYMTTRRVKKGDELYIHYGAGYWLAHMRYSPDLISDLNQLYHFEDPFVSCRA
jgi:hypothetical protein